MAWYKKRCRKFVQKCDICQRCKKKKNKYGHLPPKEAETIPWKRVNVDLIGPYTVGKGKSKHELRCMTMIDPVTGWFEIMEIESKRADYVANYFKDRWLSRYPWPTRVIYNRGSEFLKKEFQELLRKEYDIQSSKAATDNPKMNSMLECIHLLNFLIKLVTASGLNCNVSKQRKKKNKQQIATMTQLYTEQQLTVRVIKPSRKLP